MTIFTTYQTNVAAFDTGHQKLKHDILVGDPKTQRTTYVNKCRDFCENQLKVIRFEEMEVTTTKSLDEWKKDRKPSSDVEVNFKVSNNEAQLIKSVKLRKLISSIILIAAPIFLVVGLVGGAALGVAAFTGFVPVAAALQFVGCGAALANLMFIVRKLFNEIFLEGKVREKRVCTSTNFQGFVKKYLPDFIPTAKELTDSKLHDIYKNWKEQAYAIFPKPKAV